jgi:DNA-binding LacI/PurR family transcriptional regulator
MSASSHHFFQELESLISLDGGSVMTHHSAATRQTHPERLLRALLAANPADLWVLYEASIPVARFFHAEGTPAIVCGGPATDEGLSMCGFDGQAALRHAIGVFSRAGHHHIIAPSRYHRPLREQVLREECARRGWDFDPALHTPCWNNNLDCLHQLLLTRLQSPDPPTAWVLSGLEPLIVFYSTLQQLGLSVPRDLSLICIGSDPMLDCFRPSITHYTTPPRNLAMEVARMIRNLLSMTSPQCIQKLVQTEFVQGGTVGAPPKRRKGQTSP